MATGKYLSFHEARKKGLLDRFAKEHPSKADKGRFERLPDAMCRGEPKSSEEGEKTSPQDDGAC